jgi:hypothetical protein
MKKTYQPEIIRSADLLIEILEESDFFEEYEQETKDYARERLCDILTEKFLLGELATELDEPILNEEEFDTFMSEILVKNVLIGLEEKGLVGDIIDDETNETVYFLTEEGKKEGERLNESLA